MSTTYPELGMMEPERAAAIVADENIPPVTEEVPLERALGRFLTETLPAKLTMPRFDKAAVDGIGVRDSDQSAEFRLVGSIAAGDDSGIALEPGECVTIMTGAPVPAGIDRIIRFEFTESHPVEDTTVFRVIREERATNIAYRGENIIPGYTLLTPRRLTGVDLGIAASHGYATLPVARPVTVAVVVTGSELAVPGEALGDAAIYDGNSYQLAAMADAAGAEATRLGIVVDDPAETRARLAEAMERAQIVVISGGVSMGELDYVPEALQELGVEPGFHGIAVKPGRPTFFGRRGETAVFGLPGNPVSTAVQFELLVTPLIWKRSGVPYTPREAWVTLTEPFRRRNADRHEYRPAVVDAHRRATPLGYMGSGHIAALAEANAVIRIDRGVEALEEGAVVYARYLR